MDFLQVRTFMNKEVEVIQHNNVVVRGKIKAVERAFDAHPVDYSIIQQPIPAEPINKHVTRRKDTTDATVYLPNIFDIKVVK